MAAVAAKQRGRETAPVEVHQRHAARFKVLFQKLQGLRREAVVELQTAYVENFHLRQLCGSMGALGQLQQAVRAALRLVPALQAGCGAAQHDGAAALLRPPHRQIAGVVAQFVVLFERAVVFLIDYNQPDIIHRREHGQPRADHQLRLPQHSAQIILRAPACRHLAVQHRGRHVGKTVFHPLQKLRREVDFGQQKQHLPSLSQHFRHCIEIHFGLAAAGNAVQQKRLKFTKGRLNFIGSLLLFGI